jgi:hypothetical protein
MAASSSRDSTAMKTLAFITTIFLPGTFVAVRQTLNMFQFSSTKTSQTMFSMSMFNWQGKNPDAVVSSKFWIYWAVTLPLTVIVALSWRLWWSWEKRHYDRDVLMEIEGIEEPESYNQREKESAYRGRKLPGETVLRKGWRSFSRKYSGDPASVQRHSKYA